MPAFRMSPPALAKPTGAGTEGWQTQTPLALLGLLAAATALAARRVYGLPVHLVAEVSSL
jgi:hypothetical protein